MQRTVVPEDEPLDMQRAVADATGVTLAAGLGEPLGDAFGEAVGDDEVAGEGDDVGAAEGLAEGDGLEPA